MTLEKYLPKEDSSLEYKTLYAFCEEEIKKKDKEIASLKQIIGRFPSSFTSSLFLLLDRSEFTVLHDESTETSHLKVISKEKQMIIDGHKDRKVPLVLDSTQFILIQSEFEGEQALVDMAIVEGQKEHKPVDGGVVMVLFDRQFKLYNYNNGNNMLITIIPVISVPDEYDIKNGLLGFSQSIWSSLIKISLHHSKIRALVGLGGLSYKWMKSKDFMTSIQSHPRYCFNPHNDYSFIDGALDVKFLGPSTLLLDKRFSSGVWCLKYSVSYHNPFPDDSYTAMWPYPNKAAIGIHDAFFADSNEDPRFLKGLIGTKDYCEDGASLVFSSEAGGLSIASRPLTCTLPNRPGWAVREGSCVSAELNMPLRRLCFFIDDMLVTSFVVGIPDAVRMGISSSGAHAFYFVSLMSIHPTVSNTIPYSAHHYRYGQVQIPKETPRLMDGGEKEGGVEEDGVGVGVGGVGEEEEEEGEGEEEEEEEWRDDDSVEGSQSPLLQDYLTNVDTNTLRGFFIPKNLYEFNATNNNEVEYVE